MTRIQAALFAVRLMFLVYFTFALVMYGRYLWRQLTRFAGNSEWLRRRLPFLKEPTYQVQMERDQARLDEGRPAFVRRDFDMLTLTAGLFTFLIFSWLPNLVLTVRAFIEPEMVGVPWLWLSLSAMCGQLAGLSLVLYGETRIALARWLNGMAYPVSVGLTLVITMAIAVAARVWSS
jgi:hypothetical protein